MSIAPKKIEPKMIEMKSERNTLLSQKLKQRERERGAAGLG